MCVWRRAYVLFYGRCMKRMESQTKCSQKKSHNQIIAHKNNTFDMRWFAEARKSQLLQNGSHLTLSQSWLGCTYHQQICFHSVSDRFYERYTRHMSIVRTRARWSKIFAGRHSHLSYMLCGNIQRKSANEALIWHTHTYRPQKAAT